jgi:radical SAM protein with 4Fe4S-binding SPASM domain
MAFRLDCAVWETTLACNLRCTHCGSSAGTARKDELSTSECYDLCEQLAEAGCRDVSMMGGEPFMRSDWSKIAWCIKDLNMGLCLVSNGIALPDHISKLKSLEPKVVGISLDGMESSNEKIRGKGTFKRTLNSIDLLCKSGIQTTVITTVSKINYSDLPAMGKMLRKRGCNWQIQIGMPFGNFDKKNLLTAEEYYSVAMFIAKERIENRFQDLPVIGAHCFGYKSKVLPGCRWSGCTAGMSTIGITSDGSIVGCLSMGNDRFIEGNVREKRFSRIWNDPTSFRYNRGFSAKDLGPNCVDCGEGPKCRGGCSSVSYILTGRFHNDPYCFKTIERDLLHV